MASFKFGLMSLKNLKRKKRPMHRQRRTNPKTKTSFLNCSKRNMIETSACAGRIGSPFILLGIRKGRFRFGSRKRSRISARCMAENPKSETNEEKLATISILPNGRKAQVKSKMRKEDLRTSINFF